MFFKSWRFYARPEKECLGPIVETERLILILERQLANGRYVQDLRISQLC